VNRIDVKRSPPLIFDHLEPEEERAARDYRERRGGATITPPRSGPPLLIHLCQPLDVLLGESLDKAGQPLALLDGEANAEDRG